MKKSSENLSLHVYDFDNTLFRSPEPPTWWKSKKDGFWFNEPVSLDEPFIPVNPTNDYWYTNVVREAKDSISSTNTWAIMCTGRGDNTGMRYRVAELLKGKGLDFDEVHLKSGGSTSRYKAKLVFNLIKRYPNITSVEVWEDTQKNLDAIEKVCDHLDVGFLPHLIQPNPYPLDVTEQEYRAISRSQKNG
jgi:hypothetical protein